ncbi:MAG: MaoC family dehydratase [Chloroflexi bacterium]|nr:MaoC family dehydratase [Chloroflexota bacterium]
MDMEAGQQATRSLTVTRDMVEAYAGITGDYNPLHFDEEFASRTRFGRLVAQGGIATGLLHALVAMDLPGPGSVFTKQEWSFPAPVYIGDVITATGTIAAAFPRRSMARMEFTVVNQDGIEVLRGDATVLQMRPWG